MSLAFFRFYPSDYEADTSHLTTEEDGAYFRLLRLCWRTPGCSLPDDHEWIRRRVRASQEEYDRAYRPVLAEFFTVENLRVSNKRLTAEYEYSSERHRIATENGSKGGRPTVSLKTNEKDQSNGLANEKQNVTRKKANQNQNQNQKDNPLTPLLEVVSEAVALDFIEHRRELKKPLTYRASVAMAERLRAHGNPDGVLKHSIENGWQGIFPEKVTAAKSGVAEFGAFGYGTVDR
jgi:uncharacterized protein YdaU (DUF1376 family)